MADTLTATLDPLKTNRIGTSPFGIIQGTINLSSYSQTKVAFSTLLGYFATGGLLRVIPNGLSSNGYVIKWDDTNQCFRAYQTAALTANIALAAAGSAVALTSATSVTFQHTATVPDEVVISGGTYSSITLNRGGYTTPNLSGKDIIIPREVSDVLSITFTSGAAPGVESLPRAAYTASSNSAAALTEVPNSTNVGTFDFIAVGQMG
jgi:hypothetical protein